MRVQLWDREWRYSVSNTAIMTSTTQLFPWTYFEKWTIFVVGDSKKRGVEGTEVRDLKRRQRSRNDTVGKQGQTTNLTLGILLHVPRTP